MENPLKNLQIKNYYSYLLALGGVVLIISLFYEPKILSQGKLILLAIITIIYGLIEWVREPQFKNKIDNLNRAWLVYWEEESAKKGIDEIRDATWEARTRKRFEQEHKAHRILPNYDIKTWIFFIIYLVLMIGVYYLV